MPTILNSISVALIGVSIILNAYATSKIRNRITCLERNQSYVGNHLCASKVGVDELAGKSNDDLVKEGIGGMTLIGN